LLIDLRNLNDPKDVIRQGMEYVAIGRPMAEAPPLRVAAE